MAQKKIWIVEVKEVHIQPVEIEAESEAEAMELVELGGGDWDKYPMEYSCTLERELWETHRKPKEEDVL